MLRSLGVGRFVDLSVWPHIASGELQPVMTEWGSSDAPPFSALYRPEARGDAAVQGFVALLEELLREVELPCQRLAGDWPAAARPAWCATRQRRASRSRSGVAPAGPG